MKTLTHISLFTGIGGFDLAAQRAGIKNLAHCEAEDYKRELLKLRFPNSKSFGLIENFDGKQYAGKVNIISGGFPCQDISIAQTSKKYGGAQGIKGERSGLWKHYARLVGEIGPDAIIFENSSMLLSRGFEHVLCDLSELRYDCEWRLFYATQFGFPHLRERVYGVAYSQCGRWKDNLKKGGILQKIFPKEASGQIPVSIPLKRFNSQSDYSNVRMDDGFSFELDKQRIHGLGNSIVPEIAFQIFNQLKVIL
ncbi:DNA cytosine methyltransferase [Flavobacterium sp. AG291]|uniref:DNA cytosine methyltransferase n=1 Tax=Flavobacterium sp. AG291 TaxID=2184000 RepID=UPI000E0AB36A|nr:DNA cytosine methyltransferase [Flavobacterium sp. AG291]RDI07057.1 DNA (cytosine-5)-methyltransferase 1 [Flavobacterium sp. AG291]